MNRWQDWWRQAQRDLQTAEHLLVAGDFEWSCFTCQQAAEKSLKAVLELRNQDREGHSLNRLVQRVTGSDAASDALLEACARLNRLYMPTRYPDAMPEGAPVDQFLRKDAEDAIRDARLVVTYVAGLIGPAPS